MGAVTVTSPGAQAIRQRLWRTVADGRRRLRGDGLAESAIAAFKNPDRSDLGAWLEATDLHHDEYRRAHPVPDGRVAVVCVSMRPQNVDAVAANVIRQDHSAIDLVFVANGPGFDLDGLDETFDGVASVRIVVAPEGASLGAGLNLGMDATDARFVAKFDDDDVYGAAHISDSVRAHGYAGAGIVGKHSYFVSLTRTAQTRLRFPGHEFTYSGTLAGGSLVIDRSRIDDLRFEDRSLGEDRAFISACHRRGFSTFSGDRFNFTQSRTESNTWRRSDDEFVRESIAVSPEMRVDR